MKQFAKFRLQNKALKTLFSKVVDGNLLFLEIKGVNTHSSSGRISIELGSPTDTEGYSNRVRRLLLAYQNSFLKDSLSTKNEKYVALDLARYWDDLSIDEETEGKKSLGAEEVEEGDVLLNRDQKSLIFWAGGSKDEEFLRNATTIGKVINVNGRLCVENLARSGVSARARVTEIRTYRKHFLLFSVRLYTYILLFSLFTHFLP
eukprot:TRINITY_DN371_c0_g1_i2.p1 TRINITY_DN371_c0_g1~~TRINITY_DN371_c0_g1_i2.p1  ORF type:complete len:204 (-),score=28.11 TRINITY_DN371_c0_g1_i2:83-694(-)